MRMAATGIIQATEAMAKGPAPSRDIKAVAIGRPKITIALITLFELKSFKKLEIFWFFSSIVVVLTKFGGDVEEVIEAKASRFEISATRTGGRNVGL